MGDSTMLSVVKTDDQLTVQWENAHTLCILTVYWSAV